MNTGTRQAAILCLILSGGLFFAQETNEPKTVTIEEAVSLAMENNIQLSSSAIDVRMKQRDMNYAWNVFLPSVQATGTLSRRNLSEITAQTGNPLMPTITTKFSEKELWGASGGLNISLNLNLALFEGLKATRQGYEAGKIGLQQAQAQTEKNVRKAFYGILLQEGSLSLAKDKFTVSEERLKQTRTNFSNGLVPELAYLQTQLALETQKPAIMEAELNLEQQKNTFAFLLGLPAGTQIKLNGTIEPKITAFDPKELVEKNLANRLDIALLQKNIEMMGTQIRATTLQRYTPSISLNQSYQPRLSAIDADWSNKDNWTDSTGAFSLTLAFNLTNILPISASGQSLANTKDALKKLERTMQSASYSAELEIRNLVKKLEKSKASLAAMELSVSIAEKAYGLTEQGYRSGTIEFLDLKDAENSLLQARLASISEKFNYTSTMLDLEAALNTKLN